MKTVYAGRSMHNLVWAMLMKEFMSVPIKKKRIKYQLMATKVRETRAEKRELKFK